MSLTITQRAVHTCRRTLRALPQGAPVDVRALVEASGVPAQLPLVTRRLREGHWITPDGHGGWMRGGPVGHGTHPARSHRSA